MPGPPRESPDSHPSKRARQSSPDKESPPVSAGGGGAASPTAADFSQDGGPGSGSSKVGQSSSFRNVSACNRCRLRKNRCDQKLPSCASCEKASVACVGYDPITKREIPRSYVFYLETRVNQLESILQSNQIPYPDSNNLEPCSRPGAPGIPARPGVESMHAVAPSTGDGSEMARLAEYPDDRAKPQKSARQDASGAHRRTGPVNGVSFAHVVFAAVSSSVGEARSGSDKGGVRPYRPASGNGAAAVAAAGVASGTSMRDSFFGLHTKPTISAAEFPDKEMASKLIELYFEHANPQIPVLHREDFMHMFDLAYASEGRVRGPRELYMLNMVFAIGGGIIMDAPRTSSRGVPGEVKFQAQPEEYHASAIVHLEACLSSSGGGLEELQAVLLLANFALLRPVPPGLWYIVGVAVRLAVDLGLHYEDGKGVEYDLRESSKSNASIERGRREYIRDLRRRLWWCTYSFDRLVSSCVGRPFGVSDQAITTEFPSMLDDRYIRHTGFVGAPDDDEPSYKFIAKHYFRLRLLQSEVMQVLQYQQAQAARHNGQNARNDYMHTDLPSPFLQKHDSFRSWRRDIDERLYEWKTSAPTSQDTGVAFNPDFFDLNYWQAIIMLYRQSLSVPAMFEGEYHTSKEVNTPSIYTEEQRDDAQNVYSKVAEAGQAILRLYRKLHRQGMVNYTYLATHHLFMAGISYLYAIWHSPVVRSEHKLDDVDFTILAATSVFSDLIDKCPPAEACRDAFDRTAKATIKMANSTGGFGQQPKRVKRDSRGNDRNDYISAKDSTGNRYRQGQASSYDQSAYRGNSQFDGPPMQDSYGRQGQSMGHMAQSQGSHFRLSIPPNVKVEQDGSYSMGRPLTTNHMQAGTGSDAGSAGDTSSIDPVLMPSPSGAPQGQSPISVASLTPQSSHPAQFPSQQGGYNTANNSSNNSLLRSPSGSAGFGGGGYTDLQDFLMPDRGRTGSGGGPADGFGGTDGMMDMGFGLGWENMNHDFSDGQQMDLFDGFFFGGQQGGGGGGIL